MRLTIVFSSVFWMSFAAYAENAATESKTECTMGKLTRSVSVVAGDDGKGCKVNYVKDGSTSQTLWSSIRDANYCTDKSKGFIEKLTSQGWTCK